MTNLKKYVGEIKTRLKSEEILSHENEEVALGREN